MGSGNACYRDIVKPTNPTSPHSLGLHNIIDDC